jgi:hypothetical protein
LCQSRQPHHRWNRADAPGLHPHPGNDIRQQLLKPISQSGASYGTNWGAAGAMIESQPKCSIPNFQENQARSPLSSSKRSELSGRKDSVEKGPGHCGREDDTAGSPPPTRHIAPRNAATLERGNCKQRGHLLVAYHSRHRPQHALGRKYIRAARFAWWARGAQGRANGRNVATALRGGGPHMVGATKGITS